MTSTSRQSTDWLKDRSRTVRKPVGWAIGLGFCSGLLLIVQSALLAYIANGVMFGGLAMSVLLVPLCLMLGVILVRAGIAYGMERASFAASSAIRIEVRDHLMQRLCGLGVVWQRGRQTGDVVNTISDGVEALEAFYGRYLPQTALAVMVPLAMLVVIAPIDWVSGVILAVTAPLIPVFMILIGKGAERLNQRQWQRMGLLSGHFLDALQGLTTLKLFNLGQREARLIARLSDDYRRSTLAVLRIAFLSSLVLEFLATVSIAMVAVLIGFRLMWGELGFEAGFLVLLLAPEFYLPLRNLGTVYHARMEAIGAAEGMVEMLDTPVVEWPGTAIADAPRTVPTITIDNLEYRYDDGPAALQAINATIGPGETVALVGPSGAGKSTLAMTLLGLIRPQHGAVRADGVALDDMAITDWHARVAWVPQRPRLFFGSVRDNLTLGRPDAEDEVLWQALEQAQARDFVASLPQGLDTPVGERGTRLSGGEAQRLAIARALVKDAPLVVVDEISAHLDADNERRLMHALQALGHGRSLLVIAHRLATVRHADRILVMDEGRIVEQGDHGALMAEAGLYARLVNDAGAAA